MPEVMISMRNVTKKYADSDRAAVTDLSMDVLAGETVVLVGPSGCGKTTTMKMINRLIEPTSGEIVVDGTDVMKQDPVQLRRGIGYVIQSIGLMPHRTVADNIGMVPRLIGWEQARIASRIEELVDDPPVGQRPAPSATRPSSPAASDSGSASLERLLRTRR